MKMEIGKYAVLGLLLFCNFALGQDMKILINQIGYEQNAPKRAIVLGHKGDQVTTFKVIDNQSTGEVLSGNAVEVGPVDQWKDWNFWTIDFSQLRTEGTFLLECQANRGPIRSFPFLIQNDLLERNTISNVIYYFKGQRCSGLLDKADHNLKFEDSPTAATADLHGGWYDATGDYGKHLSHLSFSIYFNPQQIPFTDWTLFKTYELLKARDTSPDKNFRQYKRRLLDEALFGANYLVRSKNPKGSFFRSVDGPGGEKAPEDRRVSKEVKGFAVHAVVTNNPLRVADITQISSTFDYEIGFRNGGGMAIAALAVASTYHIDGDFSNAQYLQTAKDAFDFLQKNNIQYTNDGKENIVDDYCVLMAATELFRATKSSQYKQVADQRGANMLARLTSSGYWRADDKDRPFFHAADAGMPVVALLNYYDIADATIQPQILKAVKKSLEFELATTAEVPNPFGYARQLVQSIGGNRRTAFFFPHDTEAAPWWQGENARLASLASAARMAAGYFKDDAAFQKKLEIYAWDQLNWILGLNPFDTCMLQGSGRNNTAYMFFKSYEYTNAPGGICNGITGGVTNPHDIDFNLGFAETHRDDDWRWGEQWLPHATWYLFAVCLGH
jgi:Glycosyl hydrolase family 9/Cellulase N-terminal ig-like domain